MGQELGARPNRPTLSAAAEAVAGPLLGIFRCPSETQDSIGSVCAGGTISAAYTCAAGYTSVTRLCHICDTGYIRSGKSCDSCDDGPSGTVTWVALLVVGIVIGLYIALHGLRSHRTAALMDGDRSAVRQLFLETDVDGSGGIDADELQGMCA